LLLLLLTLRADRQSITAYRHGFDWRRIVNALFTGSVTAGIRGAARAVAMQLALSHLAGATLAGLKTATAYRPALAGLVEAYIPSAERLLRAMADGLIKAFNAGLAEPATSILQRIKNIRNALRAAGYTAGNSYAIRLGIERAVVSAFNAGVIDSALQSETEIGLRHISILDAVTTDICRDRQNLTLRVSHPYWLTNCPALHYHCRSVLVPVTDYVESERLPNIPPMPGFGAMPPEIVSLIAGVTI
jgi:hypothetical protein